MYRQIFCMMGRIFYKKKASTRFEPTATLPGRHRLQYTINIRGVNMPHGVIYFELLPFSSLAQGRYRGSGIR